MADTVDISGLNDSRKWFFGSGDKLDEAGAAEPREKQVQDCYQIGKLIGTGTFGEVREVKDRRTKQKFALKTIDKSKLDAHQMKYLEGECEVLKRIDGHTNIVKLHEIWDAPKKLHIVMELVSGGQLLERLASKGLYSEGVTAQCFRSILEAISHCHSLGVVHRDLKPENILLSDNSDSAEVKVADFGLAKLYDDETTMMMTQCGTPEFVAPEVMAGNGYTKECDIWSLGVMSYIMLCGYLPFNGSNVTELFAAIAGSELEFPPEEWDMVSTQAKDCVRQMLQKKASARPAAATLLRHPWLAKTAGIESRKSFTGSSASMSSLDGAQTRMREFREGMRPGGPTR